MKVLVVGTGGREHSIIWKLARKQKNNKNILCIWKCRNCKISRMCKYSTNRHRGIG